MRARCPRVRQHLARSFRPGTDPNTHESYTLEEWLKRGRPSGPRAHAVDGLPAEPEESRRPR